MGETGPLRTYRLGSLPFRSCWKDLQPYPPAGPHHRAPRRKEEEGVARPRAAECPRVSGATGWWIRVTGCPIPSTAFLGRLPGGGPPDPKARESRNQGGHSRVGAVHAPGPRAKYRHGALGNDPGQAGSSEPCCRVARELPTLAMLRHVDGHPSRPGTGCAIRSCLAGRFRMQILGVHYVPACCAEIMARRPLQNPTGGLPSIEGHLWGFGGSIDFIEFPPLHSPYDNTF